MAGMDDYIRQLIEDFTDAAKRIPHPSDFWDGVDLQNEAEVEDISYADQFINGIPEKLSVIFGIETIQLPPIERLTKAQAGLLYREMEILWKAYNFHPDFPKALPEHIRYIFLRDYWDSEQIRVDHGQVHIEFCEYEPELCPFPEKYCDCKEFREEEDSAGFLDEDFDAPF